MRRRSSRFPVWVRCTLVQKYYLEFDHPALVFSSYLVRGLLFALVCLFFWFRSFALALVVAAFRRLLFSACSPPLVWLRALGLCLFFSASVFPSGSRLRHDASFILFDFLFSLVVELIRVDLLSWRCGEVFQILDPQLGVFSWHVRYSSHLSP